jgi:uncharacterized protein YfaT (DUF1175 family)
MNKIFPTLGLFIQDSGLFRAWFRQISLQLENGNKFLNFVGPGAGIEQLQK